MPDLLARNPSLLALLALAAAALAAPLLAPYDPAEQLDPAAARFRPPGTRMTVVRLVDNRTLLADGIAARPGGLAVDRLGRRELIPRHRLVSPKEDGPAESRLFLLGTDRFGRDLWSRTVSGARISLGVAGVAALLALTLGIAVGTLAGLSQGPLDGIVMRGVDAFLAFPRLFLVLALAAALEGGEWLVVLVLGGTGWMGTSRLLRAELKSLRERDWVIAAHALGLSRSAILRRHLLPHAWTPVLVDTGLRLGDLILLEATLSFLGLGIQPPTPSWGAMVADAVGAPAGAWWVVAVPGVAILATVLAVNLFADHLRDRLDPRAVTRRWERSAARLN